MTMGHDSISVLFEPARALEPREQEITDALTLAISSPQHAPAHARLVRIAGIVVAVIALAVTFAVLEVRGFGAAAPKQEHDHARVVTAVQRESYVIDAAAFVGALQALQRRESRLAPSSRSMHSARTRTQRREPSRRLRCGCERRAMRPPPRSLLRVSG